LLMLLCCSAQCCGPGDGGVEQPNATVLSERIAFTTVDRGSFDASAGAEIFGKCELPATPAALPAAPTDDAGGGGAVEAEGIVDCGGADTSKAGLLVTLPVNEGSHLGICVDITQSEFLRINRIEKGAVADYNRGVPDELRIREGDFIGAVGVERDAKAKVKALGLPGVIDLELLRAVSFTVPALDKSKGQLGMEVVFYSQSSVALVRRVVEDGLVGQHNKAHPELAVREGDFVMAVSGQKGGSREIVSLLSSLREPEITITRPEGC